MLIFSKISEGNLQYLVEEYRESLIGILLADLEEKDNSMNCIPKNFTVLSLENITPYLNSHPSIDIPIFPLYLQGHFTHDGSNNNGEAAEEACVSSAVDTIISVVKSSCDNHSSYLIWNADNRQRAVKIPTNPEIIAKSRAAIEQARQDNYSDIWTSDGLLSSYSSLSSKHEEWLLLPSILGIGSVLYSMVQAVATTLEASTEESLRDPITETTKKMSPPPPSYQSSADKVYCKMNDDLLHLYLQSRLDMIARSVLLDEETSNEALNQLDVVYNYVTTLQLHRLRTRLSSSSSRSSPSTSSTYSSQPNIQSEAEDKDGQLHVMHATMLVDTLKKMSYSNSTESFIDRPFSTTFPLQTLAQKLFALGPTEPVHQCSTFPISEEEKLESLVLAWPLLPRRCRSRKESLKSLVKTRVPYREYLKTFLPLVAQSEGSKDTIFKRKSYFRRERICRRQLC